MSLSYWVRLGDGSEIGPLDTDALRSWYENGLIGRDTPAKRDGTERWYRLAQHVDVSAWKGGASGRPKALAPSRPATPAPRAGGARSAAGSPMARGASARPSPRASAADDPGPGAGRSRLLLWGGAGLALAALAAAGIAWRGRGAVAREEALHLGSERRVEDAGAGLVLDLPAAWSTVEGEPFPVPPDTSQRLHARDVPATGCLLTRPRVPGQTLPQALELALRSWRPLAPGFTEQERRETRVGERPALVVEGRREAPGGGEWASLTVWREGWHDLALLVWAPERRRKAAAQSARALLDAVQHPAGLEPRLEEALGRASKEVPFLDRTTAERLMQSSQAQVLEPADLLRRSYERLGRGLSALTAAEQGDLTRLHGALYGALTGRDRQRLADYVEKARERRPLAEAEDRAVLPLLQRGCARLGGKQQERLRQLFGRAVAAAPGA